MLRDVDFDRRAGRLGALGGQHAGDEGHRGADAGGAADDRGGDHQVAPRLVYFFLLAHGDGVVVVGGAKVCDFSDGASQMSTISLVNA